MDIYIGGDEHNTLHLLYSRFIYQFLWDIGAVPSRVSEPYHRRISHGVILGPDGQRMSKSRGNVINPDEKWRQWGVDALRLYWMFIGPFEGTMAWNENALGGTAKFLEKFERLVRQSVESTPAKQESSLRREQKKRLLNRLIQKVSDDIDDLQYNTAVAAMMETVKKLRAARQRLTKEEAGILVRLIAPFAPYLAEELWCTVLGNEFSVHQQSWPTYDKRFLKSNTSTIVVQVDGRLRSKIDIDSNSADNKDMVILRAKQDLKIKRHLAGRKIKKVIFVPRRLVNFVVS